MSSAAPAYILFCSSRGSGGFGLLVAAAVLLLLGIGGSAALYGNYFGFHDAPGLSCSAS
jgi:hypothetical protein